MKMGMRGACSAALGLIMVLAPTAMRADGPQLSLVGGSGKRGESVEVIVQLANDPDNTAVSADLDVDFPPDLLGFTPPVRTSCTIAERLASTHQVGGQLLSDGKLTLAILARAVEIFPLGDGDLATCTFEILPDASTSPAPLTLAFASLGDATGHSLPRTAVNGAILITDAPNQPTPSPTALPACAADCNGDGQVLVNEVIRGVNIALDNSPLSECPQADVNGDGAVTIGELIEAVKDVISGC